MADTATTVPGRWVLVLHGHIPAVLGHGVWPHGEDWLYEAAAGSYLPLVDFLDRMHEEGVPVRLTLGLTPILLTQLADRRSAWDMRADGSYVQRRPRGTHKARSSQEILIEWFAGDEVGQRCDGDGPEKCCGCGPGVAHGGQ